MPIPKNRSPVQSALLALSLALSLGGCNNRLDSMDPDALDDMMGPPKPTVFSDFPVPAVFDVPAGAPAIPPTVPDQFGEADSGMTSGGPCVLEPEPDTLYPRNWLRPRVRVAPVGDQNIFEIRLRAANQTGELRVYTQQTTWVMPDALWRQLSAHNQGVPISYTVRGATLKDSTLTGPPALGQKGQVSIAPVEAAGSIVYWTTASGTGFKGFSIGEETVRPVYDPPKLGTGCIGCHASTPDGEYVAFSSTANPGDGSDAFIDIRSADGKGRQPPFLTDASRSLLARHPQHVATFSIARWVDGDRVMLSEFQAGGMWQIIWTDLEAKSAAEGQGWGVIKRDGDSKPASSVNFAHGGTRIAYVSSADTGVGLIQTNGDLYTVPYNNRQGGTATPVAGASDPAWHEFYPTFSPDDSLLAFSRVPAGQSSYNNPNAELYVIPASGGQPLRLMANDPPACSGKKSPGITNSWPRWAPEVGRDGGRRYYFLTYSSTRAESGRPQLYMAPLVIDEAGAAKSYPALPLWNQPAGEGNHTPAWDVFKLVVN